MINIKDDDENPKLEIDIVAQYKKQLFIIDCKNIIISTDFLTKNRKQNIERVLREEEQKQKKRIEYIKNNFKKFGYSQKIDSFHNIIITLNKEPIERFKGIQVISVKEIPKLKSF